MNMAKMPIWWTRCKTPGQIVKELKIMAVQDGWTLSKLLKEAALEYYQRHKPGNPQLILKHWTGGEQLPETLRDHRHRWQYKGGGGTRHLECDGCGEHWKGI